MSKQETRAAIFEGLVVPHMPGLYKTAWRLTGRLDEAEDLVQQVLVKLYPRTEKMQDVERLGPWLKKVLYREFIDGLRKRSRRPEHYLSDTPDDIDVHQAEADAPEDLAIRAADRQRVREALAALKEQDRLLIIMHLVEGYTLTEMNEILHAPVQTIKTRLRRARARLKKNLMK